MAAASSPLRLVVAAHHSPAVHDGLLYLGRAAGLGLVAPGKYYSTQEGKVMSARDRERVRRIRYGQESSFKQQRKLQVLEQLSEEFGGEELARVLEQLAKEGKLKC
jgi:hypothetical protein